MRKAAPQNRVHEEMEKQWISALQQESDQEDSDEAWLQAEAWEDQ